jgi:hypothetical protein
MNPALNEYLVQVMAGVSSTTQRFASLYNDKVSTYPIPFFGNIESAKVITVGVNPANSEFEYSRRWPQSADTEYIINRLSNYFDNKQVSAHNWFNAWNIALKNLDVSYYTADAAHLDLSPRATSNIRDISNIDLFEQMLADDMRWFLGLLRHCREVKLILISGAVTKRYYINEFIRKHCLKYNYTLEGEFKRVNNPGKGKTAFHRLKGESLDIPAFFCSVSPSWDSNLLNLKIKENKAKLLTYL